MAATTQEFQLQDQTKPTLQLVHGGVCLRRLDSRDQENTGMHSTVGGEDDSARSRGWRLLMSVSQTHPWRLFLCVFLERFEPHSAGIGPLQRYSLRIFRYVHNLNASVGISVVSA